MSQVEIDVVPIEKPKRGRPKKQAKAEPTPTPEPEPVAEPEPEPEAEPVAEPTATEPEAEPVAEPEPEPAAEPEPTTTEPEQESDTAVPPEPKTPRNKKVTKPKRTISKNKVHVTVEEIHQGRTTEEEVTHTEHEPQASPSDLLAMHMSQQRLETRRKKSDKYKKLLQGNI